MTRIFVSYRHDDSGDAAGRIVDRLREHFREDDVFFDTAIGGGDRWRERVSQSLDRCDVMLVVIGRNWLTASQHGRRRLDLPDDVVAFEVGKGLERRTRVIPVLVQGAQLPRREELPQRLQGLTDYQAREIRTEAFGTGVDALLRDIAGKWLLPRRSTVISAALGVAIAVGVFGGWKAWQLRRPPPSTAPVTLTMRIVLDPSIDPEILEVDHMKLVHRLPNEIAPSLLENPNLDRPGIVEFSPDLPADRFNQGRFEADIVRNVRTSALRVLPRPTEICVAELHLPPQKVREARLRCQEGHLCTVDDDNLPGVKVAACADPAIGNPLRWLPISSALAQPSDPAPPAAVGWVVPSVQTLRRLHDGPAKPPYVEVTLRSPPLPALGAARALIPEIACNGTPIWVDGLPAPVLPVPFDAAAGIDLHFGLENLGFSGAQKGYESVALLLRFVDGNRNVIRESRINLRYVALRDQPEPKQTGEAELGLRWTATYVPGRAEDRYEVLLMSSLDEAEVEEAKQRFDGGRFALDAGGRSLSMVAVIRPPLKDHANYELKVGLREPTGQIRFSFDERRAGALCAALVEPATRRRAGIRGNTYRRDTADPQDFRTCSALVGS